MAATSESRASAPWWRRAVVYQIYPRSFADANGDGVGDLPGVIEKLDYLAWLGVDAIWLNPITPSPNDDWGYDVADYCDVHPELGTMHDLERLVAEARRRGIRVLLDLVPNHTSDRHPWFVDARSSRTARHRDWYVWADPGPGGAPPNNWLSVFGGPTWTLDEGTGQLYLHNFLASMPDLNWWNEEVRDAFDAILRFWLDRGIAGFRIDVAHGIVKDRALRDNTPATDDDPPRVRKLGQRHVYNMNRPEVHDVLRRWRRLADGYEPPALLIGETFVLDVARMAAYYGSGTDELDLAFNFPFVFSPFEAHALAGVVAETERAIPPAGWPIWTASNHDVGRFPTRWCEDEPSRARCALLLLLTLRGTALLLYGDELGMPEVAIPRERLRDPLGVRRYPEDPGRDGARTPMQWSAREGAGFCPAGVEPWLPIGDAAACNVEAQRGDPASTLELCRALVALRRKRHDLAQGRYEQLEAPAGAWAFRRGERTLVAANISSTSPTLTAGAGTILLCTDRARDGEPFAERLQLAPWQALVADAD